jgi:16S rRNA (uracil1498-N3)-methyltransferase
MSRRRFYSPPADIVGSAVTLSAEETHHLIRVLRLTPGDDAFVFDGCGREYRCRFRGVENHLARLDVQDELDDIVESPIRLTLAQALAKGEKFDLIVQKATELGVTSLVPLITRYSEVRTQDQPSARRGERWRRISLEALKQCGRRTLVDISAPRTLDEFLRSDGPVSDRWLLVFNERGGKPIREALAGVSKQHEIAALIGPEGGWSETELELLKQAGSTEVTLGPRILRTETAAIVAVTLILQTAGDLSR